MFIAGNHDLSLDKHYADTHFDDLHNEEDEHDKAIEVMKGPLAKEAGVTYLEEGVHSFTLRNGAKFTIYASPYSPGFYDWAFAYNRDKDRFNNVEHTAPGVTSIAKNPIPDFPGVDIIMTDGPPKDILDWTAQGSAGCENLMRALSGARPKLYCFGHIHEAYGSKLVTWKNDRSLIGAEAIQDKLETPNIYPDAKLWDLVPGKETLTVNAAIMDLSYEPIHSLWIINLELPRAV